MNLGGFGTTAEVVVRGRALEGKPSTGAAGRGKARKFLSTARAFLRDDIEHAKLLVTDVATGKVHEVETDGEGFYDAAVPGPFPPGARRFEVRLTEKGYTAHPLEVDVEVVDVAQAGVVVITDLDDTLVETGVTGSKAKLVLRVATTNHEDVTPYPQAAATLRALARTGAPIHYLTASPVEIAPRIERMLAERGFPAGPMYLRHYDDDGTGDPTEYKLRHIRRIMAAYPERRVIFAGDNGEQDPELFARVAKDTGRVAAAYVRATVPVAKDDPRYAGLDVFDSWREVARDLGRKRALRWMAAQRAALEAQP